MADRDDKGSVFHTLLGAALALICSVATQWFQLAKQQTFESEQTKRQEQFEIEQTKRQEQFQKQSLQAQQRFQRDEGLSAVRRAKLDRTMTALESDSSAYTKGSTQLLIHTAQLTPDIARLVEQPAPSYEAALEVANRYEHMIREMTDWLGESGPRLSVLEILTGRKGPNGEF